MTKPNDATPTLTPVERVGNFLIKRDDQFRIAGQSGGKVRTCWNLAQGAAGLTTASHRSSPQMNIVAAIASRLGIPCRLHMPEAKREPSAEMALAAATGATIVGHRPGHNSVIIRRAKDDAARRGWTYVPFGMECAAAVRLTSLQTENVVASGADRLVVPVGSGMSLAGILQGLTANESALPVLGVVVGADPRARLHRWAPPYWPGMVELVASGVPYDTHVDARLGDIRLDPVYEAKCVPFMEPGDLLWIVGIRESEAPSG